MTRRVLEIETLAAFDTHVRRARNLNGWFVQSLDLTERVEALLSLDSRGAVFLGCRFSPAVEAHLRRAGALIFPRLPDLITRLSRLATSTLSDADKSLRVLPAAIRPVGTTRRMLGRAVTAQANGDLISVLAGLQLSQPGDVLVIAAGVEDLAVAGELFGSEAVRRGLSGMVIDGLCRDTDTLARLSIPVFARGATPKAAPSQGVPEVHVSITIGGVEVNPGDVVISDDDGIVVGTDAEIGAAIDAAERIHAAEANILAALADGIPLFNKLNFEEHVARRREGQQSALTFLT